ncbi:MAG: hypothetical protein ACE367_00305 [Acidimicrobiales bacterium]
MMRLRMGLMGAGLAACALVAGCGDNGDDRTAVVGQAAEEPVEEPAVEAPVVDERPGCAGASTQGISVVDEPIEPSARRGSLQIVPLPLLAASAEDAASVGTDSVAGLPLQQVVRQNGAAAFFFADAPIESEAMGSAAEATAGGDVVALLAAPNPDGADRIDGLRERQRIAQEDDRELSELVNAETALAFTIIDIGDGEGTVSLDDQHEGGARPARVMWHADGTDFTLLGEIDPLQLIDEARSLVCS